MSRVWIVDDGGAPIPFTATGAPTGGATPPDACGWDPASLGIDRGLLAGDGCYTTMGVRGGRLLEPARHRHRLTSSLVALGLDAAPVPWDELDRLVHDADVDVGRLRVTVTAGPGGPGDAVQSPKVLVHLAAVDPRDVGPDLPPSTSLVTGPYTRDPTAPLAGHKTLAIGGATRWLRAWASERRAADYLFTTPDGRICEATTANVLLADGDRVITPTISTGCLPGTTRATLIDAGVVTESDRPIGALAEADEVMLTSAVRGITAVATVDGRALPGIEGASFRRMTRVWRAAVGLDAPSS